MGGAAVVRLSGVERGSARGVIKASMVSRRSVLGRYKITGIVLCTQRVDYGCRIHLFGLQKGTHRAEHNDYL